MSVCNDVPRHSRARPKRLLSVLLLGMLTGCGFHLAGERPLPTQMHAIFIDFVDPYKVAVPPVQEALRKRIEQRGGVVKSKIEQAGLAIRLSNLVERQDVLAIGPDGKAIEYRLVTSVRYEIDAEGKVLMAPDTVEVSSDYSFSNDQILAKEVETDRLRNYLQDEMAELLLLRIEATLSHAKSDAP